MPQFTAVISGDIEDFGRVDNAFAAFKREAEKALKKWKVRVDLNYEESQGEGEIP